MNEWVAEEFADEGAKYRGEASRNKTKFTAKLSCESRVWIMSAWSFSSRDI